MAKVLVPVPQEASTAKELKDTLWKAADKLRGSMDASQYKDVVLGLVFLKYVSDAFEERRDAIREELSGGCLRRRGGSSSPGSPRGCRRRRRRILRASAS